MLIIYESNILDILDKITFTFFILKKVTPRKSKITNVAYIYDLYNIFIGQHMART